MSAPGILDIDTTVKPLYGHQQGAVVSYTAHKPGSRSYRCHSYMLAGLRLVLAVQVAAGNQHTSKHSSPGLWQLLDRLAPEHQLWLLRGDPISATSRWRARRSNVVGPICSSCA